jgi:hypothetical protein
MDLISALHNLKLSVTKERFVPVVIQKLQYVASSIGRG